MKKLISLFIFLCNSILVYSQNWAEYKLHLNQSNGVYHSIVNNPKSLPLYINPVIDTNIDVSFTENFNWCDGIYNSTSLNSNEMSFGFVDNSSFKLDYLFFLNDLSGTNYPIFELDSTIDSSFLLIFEYKNFIFKDSPDDTVNFQVILNGLNNSITFKFGLSNTENWQLNQNKENQIYGFISNSSNIEANIFHWYGSSVNSLKDTIINTQGFISPVVHLPLEQFPPSGTELTFTCDYAVGTEKQFVQELSGKVFPIPAKDFIYITTDKNITEATIVDSKGKVVLTRQFLSRLDVSSLTPGAYNLLLRDDTGNSYFKKFLKE